MEASSGSRGLCRNAWGQTINGDKNERTDDYNKDRHDEDTNSLVQNFEIKNSKWPDVSTLAESLSKTSIRTLLGSKRMPFTIFYMYTIGPFGW